MNIQNSSIFTIFLPSKKNLRITKYYTTRKMKNGLFLPIIFNRIICYRPIYTDFQVKWLFPTGLLAGPVGNGNTFPTEVGRKWVLWTHNATSKLSARLTIMKWRRLGQTIFYRLYSLGNGWLITFWYINFKISKYKYYQILIKKLNHIPKSKKI